MSIQEYMTVAFGAVQTTLLWLYLRKIEKNLERHSDKIEQLEKRDDTQDDLHSIIVGAHFDSSKIAQGLQSFPHIKWKSRDS